MIKRLNDWFGGQVAYQIYPRSFFDSNNDGIGDLPGIIKKLDYLAGKPDSLGVKVIWLCPFYESPMADFGYDISDYYGVDPIFGTIDDAFELIKQAHQRGIKVLIDLVANHTSDQHPWFIDSKSAINSVKRDWYIWHDGRDGGPPNDWLSVFGGSAWQYDEITEQYYLHSFSVHQPDLNWENREVRQAIKEVMRFWLDMGVDGFRADAVYWLSKDHRFRNDPPRRGSLKISSQKYERLSHIYSQKGPHLYAYLREMTDVLAEYRDRFMVIEAYPEAGKKAEEYLKFYRYVDFKRLAPFNFEGIYFSWNASEFKLFIDKFQAALKPRYLPIYTLGNHDKSRIASRIGVQAAPAAAVMLLSLPGMPFIYYGDELGMTDTPVPLKLRKDPLSLHGEDRDKARSPMQWDSSATAGFSKAKPWLPPAPDYKTKNVFIESRTPSSMLSLYKNLIKLRTESEALRLGKYLPLELDNREVYGFIRKSKEQSVVVVVNFSGKSQKLSSRKLKGQVILSSYQDSDGLKLDGSVQLRANEALIISA